MFKFFQKKQTVNVQDTNLAKISYYIDEVNQKPKLSVDLYDYSNESINALCDLIDLIYSDKLALETIAVIQNFLIEAKQEEALIRILLRLESKITEKKSSQGPCIKPSEMI